MTLYMKFNGEKYLNLNSNVENNLDPVCIKLPNPPTNYKVKSIEDWIEKNKNEIGSILKEVDLFLSGLQLDECVLSFNRDKIMNEFVEKLYKLSTS